MSRLNAVLLLLFPVVTPADPEPIPEGSGGTVETPARECYSWEAGLFGNLVPGRGYFLIGEPAWGAVEIGLVGSGVALVITGSNMTGFVAGIGEMVIGGCIAGAA